LYTSCVLGLRLSALFIEFLLITKKKKKPVISSFKGKRKSTL